MELRIYIRHTQFIATEAEPTKGIAVGDPIRYTGQNTQTLSAIKGNVPMSDWLDVTDYVSDLEQFSITWTKQVDNLGNVTTNSLQTDRNASGTLTFTDVAYDIIRRWLLDDIGSPLNAIDVKIEDVGCGFYDELIIKPSQIRWCEDGECAFNINLQQKQEAYHCIQRTLIHDNWQGWFHKHTAKQHPRFAYCNAGGGAMLIILWYLSFVLFIFMLQITPLVNSVILIIGTIKTIIDIIGWIFGKKPDFSNNFNFFNPLAVMSSFYEESSGCGFNHVAPLIRDYIKNVCDKCDVNVNGFSAPLFFLEVINIDTSAEREQGIKPRHNPYYNATYLAPTLNRGFRRNKHLFSKEDNPIYYWNEGNAPLLSLEQFLDLIKGVFNADWRIQNDASGKPTLYFQRKDWFNKNGYLYDFTDEATRAKMISGVCYGWNEQTMPAFMSGIYNTDPMDSEGNLARRFMNDKVSIGSKTNNVLFSGELNKTLELGATKFRQDGVDRDYLMEAVRALRTISYTIPGIGDLIALISLVPTLRKFDYSLLMSDDTNGFGKIIIWDATSGYKDSMAVNEVGAATIDDLPVPTTNPHMKDSPNPNPKYNPNQSFFRQIYEIITTTINSASVLEGISYVAPYGWDRQARLINYPMYFCSKFKDNLYDWFHWIDDPNVNPKMNMTWELDIDLCCEDLKKLGVLDGAGMVKLMEKVKLPNQYYQVGTLTEIEVNYNVEKESKEDGYKGRFIKLKGIL